MIILGINAYHGDSSACIVVDGELIAAVEEERFTRIKHWAGLPIEAIKFCLNKAACGLEDVDHVAINRDPKANLFKKAFYTFTKRPAMSLVKDRVKNANKIRDIRRSLMDAFFQDDNVSHLNKVQVHPVEHHVAHLASSFFVSPFEKAAVVSIDGFGDFVGAMWGLAEGNKIEVKHRTFFPHSLGLFYQAITQYLGFLNYGDEYKVMGLAAYGEPEFMDEMRDIAQITPDATVSSPLFKLNLDYFVHHVDDITLTWTSGEPHMGPVFSNKLEEFLGKARQPDEEIGAKHKNMAASLQKRYEEIFFHILNLVYQETQCSSLALAGGCAMNSLANGKIFDQTPFSDIYIQPAAGDAGGAIGAAYYVWNQVLEKPRTFVLESPYLGPDFSKDEVELLLDRHDSELKKSDCTVQKISDSKKLCELTAGHIAQGKVIGWFQGRMEWGPRALGNRSILCDPRRSDMKDIMNLKIKRRESFRPFAPSIHIEATEEYFETSYPDPFMLKVYKIKPEKRDNLPAVTHVDGTGRLQTVAKKDNPLYWQLIDEFRKISGVPILLNTSFNENEPIVCHPKDALLCFLRTKMDVIVLDNYLIYRDDVVSMDNESSF